MNTSNAKLLGIYYSVQKVLANNLAAPLGNGLKNTVGTTDVDHMLLAEKAIPFLKNGISVEKLTSVIDKVLSNIDQGNISPDQYLGQEFTVEQTIDQFEKHDSFIHVYSNFMHNVKEESGDAKNEIIEQVTIDLIKLKLNSTEALQLKALFNDEAPRAPITLEVNELTEIVDSIYDATCEVVGPMKTDIFLSSAVKQANSVVHTFDASAFL